MVGTDKQSRVPLYPAGIIRRLLSWAFDVVLGLATVVLIMAAMLYQIHSIPREQCGIDACGMAAMSVLFGIPMFAAVILPFAYLLKQMVGRSPGSWATGTAIVNRRGDSPAWRGVIRFMVPLCFAWLGFTIVRLTFDAWPEDSVPRAIGIVTAMLVTAVPYLVACWNREHRALHDIAAGTWVVLRDTPAAVETPIDEPAPGTM